MDGIIFDVDGTIWNATKVVAQAWTNAIKNHSDLGITVTQADLESLFGKTMEEIYDQIFQLMPDKEERDRIAEACIEYEQEALRKEPGLLYEGIVGVIKILALKYPLYIVSNCQSGYIELMLEVTGLEYYFKDHLCYGDTLQPKTYTIPKIMEQNNLKDVVYIGDTFGDFDACQKIGIPFVFASYGFGEVSHAKWRIDHPLQLLQVIESIAEDMADDHAL